MTSRERHLHSEEANKYKQWWSFVVAVHRRRRRRRLSSSLSSRLVISSPCPIRHLATRASHLDVVEMNLYMCFTGSRCKLKEVAAAHLDAFEMRRVKIPRHPRIGTATSTTSTPSRSRARLLVLVSSPSSLFVKTL